MYLSNLRTDLNHLINLRHQPIRSISFFGWGKKKDESIEPGTELVEEGEGKQSIWDHLDEEQIEKIRNRSKLTTKERDRLMGKLSDRIYLTELYQYKTTYVRNLYATFGKETGLKPGVCWPRKSELEFRKKYEETFYPPLDQLMKELADEKAQEAKEIKEREDEIRKGLKKMAKYKKEFYAKFNQKQSEIKEKEDKEAKRVEEICDFLGYAISPDDPRFEAAAEKKAEIERKEQMKSGIVKKTRQQKMLEELQQLIEQNQSAEEANKKESKNDGDQVDGTPDDDQVNKKEAKKDEQIDEVKKKDKVKKKKDKSKEDETKDVEPKD